MIIKTSESSLVYTKSYSSNLIMNYSTTRIAYYHGIGKNHHLYTLENLSHEIGSFYIHCNKNFKLNSEEVVNIQKSILSGTYTLSAFEINICPILNCVDYSPYQYIMHCTEFPDKCIVVTVSESDKLVLTALGKVLNDIFDSIGEECISMPVHSFYDELVLSRKNVDSLYRIDMTRSLLTIDQGELISDLKSILGKKPILDLVLSYFHADYKVSQYEGFSFNRISIPPVCLISNVLLNYELRKLDYPIQTLFNNIDYERHIHEMYIYNWNSNNFEHEMDSLFNDLGLAGKMYTIKPGTDVPCFIGIVGLDNNGKIYLNKAV